MTQAGGSPVMTQAGGSPVMTQAGGSPVMTQAGGSPVMTQAGDRAVRWRCAGGPAGLDEGSTMPLIVGFFVVAALVVGGGVAAGDAFVDQRDVQGVCDGATLAAASALDTSAVRGGDGGGAGSSALLGAVQQAAATYLARDPARQGVTVTTALSPDGVRVDATCTQVLPLTFGSLFGFADGVQHVVTSSASTVLR